MKKIYDKMLGIIWMLFKHFIGVGSIAFASFGWYMVLTQNLGRQGMLETLLLGWWLIAVPLVAVGYVDEIVKTITRSMRRKIRG